MKKLKSRVAVDGIVYPEGMRWFDGKVWFSDILDSKVYCYDPQTSQKHVVAELSDRPSGLGFLPDGRLVIAGISERKLLRLDADGLHVLTDLSHTCAMINDMVTDGFGRTYVDAHFEDERDGGGIILVEPSGVHRVVATKMKTPNGLAISADGRTLVVNDLFANCILAFDILDDGGLTDRRVFANLGDRSPDGLCLDEQGGAWIWPSVPGQVPTSGRGWPRDPRNRLCGQMGDRASSGRPGSTNPVSCHCQGYPRSDAAAD